MTARCERMTDHRAKRPWVRAHRSQGKQRTCIFDYYSRQAIGEEQKAFVTWIINEIGNRQFDATSGAVKLGFGKFALHDAEAVFEGMDCDASGSVDSTELKTMLDDLQIVITQKEVDTLVEILDKDGNGSLDLGEIKALFRAARFHAGRKLADSRAAGFSFPERKVLQESSELTNLLDMRNVPDTVEHVFTALMLLVQPEYSTPEDCNWPAVQRWVHELGGVNAFLDNLRELDAGLLDPVVIERALRYVKKWNLNHLAYAEPRRDVLVAVVDWILLICETAVLASRSDPESDKLESVSDTIERPLYAYKKKKKKKKGSAPHTYNGHQRPSIFTMVPRVAPSRQQEAVEMDVMGDYG